MLNLRDLQFEDIEMVRNWRNSPEVANFMYSDEEISEEQQLNWWNKVSKENNSKYWIIENDNKPIGLASLTDISKLFESCYWAFYIGDNSNLGAGIGSKVEYFIINYVFDELNLNKLRCEVFTTNEKVISMHEKFGFRREAYYRQHIRKNGKWLDVVGLALLKKEWKIIKSQYLNLAI